MINKMLFYILFVSAVLLNVFHTTAQDRVDPKMDPRNFPGGFILLRDAELNVQASDLSKYQVLDTADLMVTYRKSYIQDTIKKEVHNEVMVLQIGQQATYFCSQPMYRLDSIYTANRCLRQTGGMTNVDITSIYHILKSNSLSVVSRLPFVQNTAMVYEEDRPVFKWKIEQGCSVILGYGCRQATTYWGGRTWTVWFTPDIPIDIGPWKLSGLPGLILKAIADSGEYTYEAIGISQHRHPILWYEWHLKKMTKSAYLKFERQLHAAPCNYVNQGGTVLFLSFKKHNGKLYLDEENWSVPYNPIELE